MTLKRIVLGLGAVASTIATPLTPIDLIRRAPQPGIVITQCSRPGVLALAFDDGPYEYTQTLVDILDEGNAKGTFFFTGTLYGCIFGHVEAVQNAFASGHQIASHTWTHPQNFGSLSSDQLRQEMGRLEEAYVNLIGKKPLYMRPPYLATGGNVLPTMSELNYKVITDDIDTGDWNNQSPAASEQLFVQAGASGNGHIPLMHETYSSTVNELVPWLINWANQNNLELVTVADCLGDADGAYQTGNFTGDGNMSC